MVERLRTLSGGNEEQEADQVKETRKCIKGIDYEERFTIN